MDERAHPEHRWLEQPGPFAAEIAAWLARTRRARPAETPWARSAR